jgi:hypothetical protein
MSYELIHNTSRRAPKLTSPSIAQAYSRVPKEGERGECHDVSKTFGRWACSECGRAISLALTDEPPRFCCGCGRRVVGA